MIKILSNISQVVTVDTYGRNFKRGNELSELGVITNSSIVMENEYIKEIIPSSSVKNYEADEIIDLSGKIVLPGLVECHTHTAFAGSRAEEFKKKLSGISYEEIAKLGGGINKTVNSVRKSSIEDLINLISPRINYFISRGITTLEIKSGYGLDFQNEVKLLKVINFLNQNFPIDIIPTFLGAHTYPPEFKQDHDSYIKLLTSDLLPYISENKLANFCDGFCEATAFSADEIETILSKAKNLGFNLRLHTDQFNSIGGIDVAIKLSALSVDHLEVVSDQDINKLGKTEIVCVVLPGVSLFLNHKIAPARKLIDNNAILALSTDYNPGSSNISDINLIMSLAALTMEMTIEETISAVTINSAKALNMNKETGSIEIGKKADFSVFDANDYSDIVYNVGKNLNCMTIKNGEVIYIAD